MASVKTIVLALVGLTSFSTTAHSQTSYSPNQIGMSMMRLNTMSLDNVQAYSDSGSVWSRMRGNFRMSEVNPELVRRHEGKFVANSAYFNRTLERSRPYLYHITTEVARRNMPAEIALLPFIESAFVTKARSHVGASGLWQFMPATGRHYGLEQTPLYDGRHDIYAATNAALDYLQYLYGLFGDWSLALAAYNWGEGNVGRAINRARARGLDPIYENLDLPSETRNYVPKLLAVRNIVNNPQSFGMFIADVDNTAYFKAINIEHPIDVAAVARLAGISEQEFLALNPAFKVPVLVPKVGRKMLLPVQAVSRFEQNFRKADPSTLLSWDVYTPFADTTATNIALETGMSVGELKAINGMRGEKISAGRSILVAKSRLTGSESNTNIAQQHFAGIDADPNPNDNRLQTVPDFIPTNATAPVSHVTRQPNLPPQLVAAAAPIPAPTVAPKAVVAQAQPLQLADNQAIALTTETVENNNDVIAQFDAEEAVRKAVAEADAREAEAKKRAAQLAEARAKQQQREEARLLAAQQKEQQAGNSHKVVAGDTLFNIAQRYDVSVADLIAANNIQGNHIRLGQVLKLSGAKTGGKTQVAAKKAEAKTVSYTVRKGDTITAIAKRFNMDVSEVQKINNNSTNLIPGQQIKLQGS